MTSSGAVPESTTEKAPNKVPAVKHRLCQCQITDEEGGFARCGERLAGGPVTYITGVTRPMDVCVICTDIRLADTPCQYCGLKPSHYFNK